MKCSNCGRDPHYRSQGVLINRRASLGAESVVLRERIRETRGAVRQAARERLVRVEEEIRQIRHHLAHFPEFAATDWLQQVYLKES